MFNDMFKMTLKLSPERINGTEITLGVEDMIIIHEKYVLDCYKEYILDNYYDSSWSEEKLNYIIGKTKDMVDDNYANLNEDEAIIYSIKAWEEINND